MISEGSVNINRMVSLNRIKSVFDCTDEKLGDKNMST